MEDVSSNGPSHPRSNRSDIFEKCWNFNRARALQEAGLYLYFEVFGARNGCGDSEVMLGNRKILMFGSNDYLDLTNHPQVKEAAIAAIGKSLAGASPSAEQAAKLTSLRARLTAGTNTIAILLSCTVIAMSIVRYF